MSISALGPYCQQLNPQRRTIFRKILLSVVVFAFCSACCVGVLLGKEISQEDQEVQKEKLMPLQEFIGGWRGVAMQKLGGNARWSAESEWAWSFDEGVPAIVFELTPGRYFTSGRIIPGKGENAFVLQARHIESEVVETFSGFIDENKTLWKRQFESDMGGRISWGVGLKLNNRSQNLSTVMTWDRYPSLADALEALNIYGGQLPRQSKMLEYDPDGWTAQVIVADVMWVD